MWSVNNELRLQVQVRGQLMKVNWFSRSVQANEAWSLDYLESFGKHMLDVIKLMDSSM